MEAFPWNPKEVPRLGSTSYEAQPRPQGAFPWDEVV